MALFKSTQRSWCSNRAVSNLIMLTFNTNGVVPIYIIYGIELVFCACRRCSQEINYFSFIFRTAMNGHETSCCQTAVQRFYDAHYMPGGDSGIHGISTHLHDHNSGLGSLSIGSSSSTYLQGTVFKTNRVFYIQYCSP